MKYIKNLVKNHSVYLIGLALAEIIIAVFFILSFVYQDHIDFSVMTDLALFIQNIYSQTWWGFVLYGIGFIAILTLTALIYDKLEYLFISTCIWVLLFVLGININGNLTDALGVSIIFIPLFLIHIIVYRAEVRKKEVLKELENLKEKDIKSKKKTASK